MGFPRILIVEDDVDFREVIQLGLGQLGCNMHFSGDGRKAVELIRETKFDSIILDYRIPGLNGLQVAAIIRSSRVNRQTPIILISGWLTHDDVITAHRIGVNKTLAKPLNIGELISGVSSYIESSAQKTRFNANIIGVFLEAATDFFDTCFSDPVTVGKPAMRLHGKYCEPYASALISVAGAGVVGSVAVTIKVSQLAHLASLIRKSMRQNLSEEIVRSMIHKIGLLVIANIRQPFEKLGILLVISKPEVVMGCEHRVVHRIRNEVIVVPISKGPFTAEIEFCLDCSQL